VHTVLPIEPSERAYRGVGKLCVLVGLMAHHFALVIRSGGPVGIGTDLGDRHIFGIRLVFG
jgi:hypothetical protein